MKLIEKLVELWYSWPRPNVQFNIRWTKPDSRSVQWWKDRRKYGFDERELWNLSFLLWEKISEKVGHKGNEYDFKRLINDPTWIGEIKWFADRVKRYSEIAFSTYQLMRPEPIEGGDWNGSTGDYYKYWFDEVETREILDRYIVLLDKRLSGDLLSEDEADFIVANDRFGW